MKKVLLLSFVLLFGACSGTPKSIDVEIGEQDVIDGDELIDKDVLDDSDDVLGESDEFFDSNDDDVSSFVCNDGEIKREGACGLNARGEYEWVCKDGVWLKSERCDDPDVCTDSQKNYKVSCGINERGKYEWICVEGEWRKTDVCKDSDECVDDSFEHLEESTHNSCGVNNRGVKQKKCIDGFWVILLESDEGYCDDPDECVDGTIEHREEIELNSCGPNMRGWKQKKCEDGLWEPLLEGDDEYCDDIDYCVDGVIEHLPEVGGNECGFNNRGWRQWLCTTGYWTPYALGEDNYCDDPDECVDDSVAHLEEIAGNECGLNGRGWKQKKCIEGVWMGILEGAIEYCDDPDVCVDNSVDETTGSACGYYQNGHKKMVCETGVWNELDECLFDCPEKTQGYGEIYYINSRAMIDNYKDATVLKGIFLITQYDSSGHQQIDSIAGLDCLRRVEGSLGIDSSDSTDLKEFHSLEKVDEALAIYTSNALTSLDGLRSIEEIGKISFTQNNNLASISQLLNLTTAPLVDSEKTTVKFEDNSHLPQCEVDAFIEFLEDSLGFSGLSESSGNDSSAQCE
ncbi:hypothetical protein KAH37_07895 [bacterium]|nr:hypothetical protein [bacterium]